MGVAAIKERLPDFAKDIRLNLTTVTTAEGCPGLSLTQVLGCALACAWASKSSALAGELLDEAQGTLSPEAIEAARSAATIMAMNNVYYRFVHLVEDADYGTMRANLRMQVIARPGIDKLDFELYSMAVSAINGCGMCMKSHAKALADAGMTKEGVQSAVRIASVIHAAAQALEIADSA